MPPRALKKETAAAKKARLAKEASQESSGRASEQESGEEVQSPVIKKPSRRTTAADKRSLANVDALGLNALELEPEAQSESEKTLAIHDTSDNKSGDSSDAGTGQKPSEKSPEEVSNKQAQLKKDADNKAKELKENLETERTKKRKEREGELSASQTADILRDQAFVKNLTVMLSAQGTPPTDVELNEALTLYKANPSIDIAYYFYYVRGIQKGLHLRSHKLEMDLKKICEMFTSTLKLYQATQKGLEKTQTQMSSMIFGLGSTPKVVGGSSKPPKSQPAFVPIGNTKSGKEKVVEPTEKDKEEKRSKKMISESISLDDVEESTYQVKFETAEHYAMALRTTVNKFLRSLGGKATVQDFMDVAKSKPEEKWKSVYDNPDKEFCKEITKLVKEKCEEREKEEAEKE